VPTRHDDATPLWLSHHQPGQHERCVRWGRHVLCRRCLVLYPVALVALVVPLLTGDTPAPWLLFLLPLPTVVEWWAEHLQRWSYSPRRQTVTSSVAGIGLGFGFARYLRDPGDPWFWAMVVLYGGSCAAVAVWRLLDERAP